jgi:biopolymer transport protein TolR
MADLKKGSGSEPKKGGVLDLGKPVPKAVPPGAVHAVHKKKSVVHSHDATRPGHTDSMSEINITPLIDVMLVLLIIFMVVTPLTQKGLDISLPQTNNAATPPPKSDDQIVLTMDETGVAINKSPVATMEELDSRLKEIFQTRSDKTMFVKADGKILYGKVVDAMDLAKGAGVTRIGIISEKFLEQSGAGGVPPAGGGGQ